MDFISSTLYPVSDHVHLDKKNVSSKKHIFNLVSHCSFIVRHPNDVDGLQVRVGSSEHAKGGQMIYVSRVINHPKYIARTTDFDFSLLQLAEILSFTSKIQPITLPNADAEIADGTLCTTSG